VGFISTFPPKHCGVGDYTYELVNYLSRAKTGNSYFVNTFDDSTGRSVTSAEGGLVSNGFVSNGIHPISLELASGQQLQEHALEDTLMVRRNLAMNMWGRSVVRAVKKDSNPELIHVQSTTLLYPRMFDTFPLFLGKTPLVVTAHDVPHYRQFHMLPFLRLIYSRASSIIVLSNQVASELVHYHGSEMRTKVRVMHHGVDIDRFNPKVSPKPFYDWLGLEPASFTIMSFGFLRQGKGTELALRAFKEFVVRYQGGKDLRFIIAGSSKNGDQTYQNQLISLSDELGVKGQVVTTGYVPSELVPSALASADLLVYPYLGVSQSGPVHRSIASGRPVIVSDLEGFRDIITDGENGLVVKKNDVSSIADAFERLYGNEGLRKRLGENARKYATKYLDWRKIVRETIELYQSLLNASR
jgi:glycosyltransferase involved in cell wall biosynthesis